MTRDTVFYLIFLTKIIEAHVQVDWEPIEMVGSSDRSGDFQRALPVIMLVGFMYISGIGAMLLGCWRTRERARQENIPILNTDENHQPIEIEKNAYEEELEKIGYPDTKIPEDYLGPVTHCIMIDPFQVHPSGYSFERETVETIIQHAKQNGIEPLCPLSRTPIESYARNFALKNAIAKWVERKKQTIEKRSLADLTREQRTIRLLKYQSILNKLNKQKPLVKTMKGLSKDDSCLPQSLPSRTQ